MSEEFNSKIFYGNIEYLLRKQKKKIGELESETGVSTGYISRASKDTSAKPGIDFVIKTADVLGVSIDSLLCEEMYKMNETEAYINRFISKVIDDTKHEKAAWQRMSPNDYDELADTAANHESYPLIIGRESIEANSQLAKKPKTVFMSKKIEMAIAADYCYELKMNLVATLYLMSYMHTTPAKSALRRSKEIWICRKGVNEFICCSTNLEENVSVESLYREVTKYFEIPRIRSDIREFMDMYMAK